MCAQGAPEARALHALGFAEGPPNSHPGQGTANRRFYFPNLYLELLWVGDEAQARSELTSPTRLWQRWIDRDAGACPFGLVFRPENDSDDPPFVTWDYRPIYLPPGLSMQFAKGTPLSEPELVVLPFSERFAAASAEPARHRSGVGEISGVEIMRPNGGPLSTAAAAVAASGAVSFAAGPDYMLELRFLAGLPVIHDLRPTLPLVLRGEAPGARAS